MRLVTVDEILQFIRFDSIEELNQAFDSALLTASVTLSSLLDTDFARNDEAVDFYYVEATPFIGQEYSIYLETTNGFIDADQPFRVFYGTTRDGATEEITSSCVFDYEKGKILITGFNLDNLWVKVTYACGFEETGYEPVTYEDVPQWLKTAAVYQSILEFDRMNPDFRKENSGTRINISELQANLNSALEKHMRYQPYCISPVM